MRAKNVIERLPEIKDSMLDIWGLEEAEVIRRRQIIHTPRYPSYPNGELIEKFMPDLQQLQISSEMPHRYGFYSDSSYYNVLAHRILYGLGALSRISNCILSRNRGHRYAVTNIRSFVASSCEIAIYYDRELFLSVDAKQLDSPNRRGAVETQEYIRAHLSSYRNVYPLLYRNLKKTVRAVGKTAAGNALLAH